jgi:hypothetical protein
MMANLLSRKGLSQKWREREIAIGRLSLDAMIAEKSGRPDAPARFAQIAPLEEALARDVPNEPHLRPHWRIHLFSAASCWAKAGQCARAVQLCDELLADPDAPPRFRQDVAEYRARWAAALAPSDPGVIGREAVAVS